MTVTQVNAGVVIPLEKEVTRGITKDNITIEMATVIVHALPLIATMVLVLPPHPAAEVRATEAMDIAIDLHTLTTRPVRGTPAFMKLYKSPQKS